MRKLFEIFNRKKKTTIEEEVIVNMKERDKVEKPPKAKKIKSKRKPIKPRKRSEDIMSTRGRKPDVYKYLKTDNYEKAVERLLKFGAKAAVVTCGDKGCYGADQTGCKIL